MKWQWLEEEGGLMLSVFAEEVTLTASRRPPY